MELNITPEDIDKYVKDALLESTIGKTVKEALDKAIKDIFSRSYNNPLEDFVKKEITNITKEYMQQEHILPLLQQSIAKAITPLAIENIVKYGLKKLSEDIESYKFGSNT